MIDKILENLKNRLGKHNEPILNSIEKKIKQAKSGVDITPEEEKYLIEISGKNPVFHSLMQTYEDHINTLEDTQRWNLGIYSQSCPNVHKIYKLYKTTQFFAEKDGWQLEASNRVNFNGRPDDIYKDRDGNQVFYNNLMGLYSDSFNGFACKYQDSYQNICRYNNQEGKQNLSEKYQSRFENCDLINNRDLKWSLTATKLLADDPQTMASNFDLKHFIDHCNGIGYKGLVAEVKEQSQKVIELEQKIYNKEINGQAYSNLIAKRKNADKNYYKIKAIKSKIYCSQENFTEPEKEYIKNFLTHDSLFMNNLKETQKKVKNYPHWTAEKEQYFRELERLHQATQFQININGWELTNESKIDNLGFEDRIYTNGLEEEKLTFRELTQKYQEKINDLQLTKEQDLKNWRVAAIKLHKPDSYIEKIDLITATSLANGKCIHNQSYQSMQQDINEAAKLDNPIEFEEYKPEEIKLIEAKSSDKIDNLQEEKAVIENNRKPKDNRKTNQQKEREKLAKKLDVRFKLADLKNRVGSKFLSRKSPEEIENKLDRVKRAILKDGLINFTIKQSGISKQRQKDLIKIASISPANIVKLPEKAQKNIESYNNTLALQAKTVASILDKIDNSQAINQFESSFIYHHLGDNKLTKKIIDAYRSNKNYQHPDLEHIDKLDRLAKFAIDKNNYAKVNDLSFNSENALDSQYKGVSEEGKTIVFSYYDLAYQLDKKTIEKFSIAPDSKKLIAWKQAAIALNRSDKHLEAINKEIKNSNRYGLISANSLKAMTKDIEEVSKVDKSLDREEAKQQSFVFSR